MSEQIFVRFSRKPTNLDEVKANGADPRQVEVTETKELLTSEYDFFTQSFLRDRDWLNGKGGVCNGKWQVIEVIAPDRPALYVNPEGYTYARYVGLREEQKPAPSGPRYPHVRIQLVGKDGNAFFIMGRCQQAAKAGQVPPEEIKAFMEEARSGDYNHLLATCMRWFDCF